MSSLNQKCKQSRGGNDFLFLSSFLCQESKLPFSSCCPGWCPSRQSSALQGGARYSIHSICCLGFCWSSIGMLVFSCFSPFTFKGLFKSCSLNLSRNSFAWEMCNANFLTQLLKALLCVFLQKIQLQHWRSSVNLG